MGRGSRSAQPGPRHCPAPEPAAQPLPCPPASLSPSFPCTIDSPDCFARWSLSTSTPPNQASQGPGKPHSQAGEPPTQARLENPQPQPGWKGVRLPLRLLRSPSSYATALEAAWREKHKPKGDAQGIVDAIQSYRIRTSRVTKCPGFFSSS